MDIELFIDALGEILQWKPLIMIFAGVAGGILIGSLPGLTATMGVALLVPFTFGLPFNESIGMLLGIFSGSVYGGSISAILINTPGTPAAAATLLDGYPLSQKGEAGRALSMSVFASFVGGFTGALIMTFLSPQISQFALEFSAAEYFGLATFGLSIIISVSGKSILKGIMVGFLGLLISTIGMDPVSGYPRFTFGSMNLFEGPAFIPTLIGLFAFAEVFKGVEQLTSTKQVVSKINSVFPSFADIKRTWKDMAKSSVLGTFIGSIPGAGSDIAAFVGYSEAKRRSKTPEKFGTGQIEGVAAAESANNACSGGAMIPMLSLGVPGDAVTAILLGAFVIQGIQPGPMLYKEDLDVVYSVFSAMLVANIAMLIVGFLGVRFFARAITVRKSILLPAIFIMSIVGAYSMRNNMFDVWLALGFGVLGYFLQRYRFPVSPILLALILGPMAEANLRRALIIADNSMIDVLSRPITATFLILGLATLVMSILRQRRSK
ncbi:MAG: C4-dicarboxylate ABC transporter permease [Kordiimonadaceae bacterium]|jgi:putative tricarboxylic transport membrane protein|nr:C4-dicarboxylate ABC transporter permease [Kordiimonadaceae bacterium]MBT6328467.1 C4-dicarboxylate ABC transporter permease [Kordiimonadaceae bacterium]MBT7605491.1 C4-dicarboxylate ABC transporter permease [Kordiimonadaceae bacterium]